MRKIYPYSDMEVGDSFYVPDKRQLHPGVVSLRSRGILPPEYKIIVRPEGEGQRVWRVE